MNDLTTQLPFLLVTLAALLGVADRWRLRRALRLARHSATHDTLTGLANRTGLATAWPLLAPASPAVVVLDLDGFKPVNDVHGHAAGDLVLSTIAARLRAGVDGLAARLGGDEFAAILLGDAASLVRSLAWSIAQPITLPNGATVRVTASVGVTRSAGDLADALAQADAAMYRAKVTGCGIASWQPHRDDTGDPHTRPALRTRDLRPAAPVEATR